MADPVIRTYSGVHFDLYNPKPGMVRIEDIAHGLANKCRFGGQCPQFYSVAQHSVYVAELLPLPLKLWGLLHDAGEAYLCDVIRPIKDDVSIDVNGRLQMFGEVEERILRAVAETFGLPWPVPPAVYEADDVQLHCELPWWSGRCHVTDFTVHGACSPRAARTMFMAQFKCLADTRK